MKKSPKQVPTKEVDTFPFNRYDVLERFEFPSEILPSSVSNYSLFDRNTNDWSSQPSYTIDTEEFSYDEGNRQ